MSCLALLPARAKSAVRLDLAKTLAYGPADLQSAYKLTSAARTRGRGETVALVDAYNDPDAVHDVAVYRKDMGLPACDRATGAGCVTVVNEQGRTHPLPPVDRSGEGGWELEESLDMEMVAAICPNCRILLVEATTDYNTDLNTAEDTAVRLGAKFVSNSWGGYGTAATNQYFNHPGVAITAAAGDYGLGTQWPASTQFVTSVGGTTLVRAAGTARGWRETVWSAQPFVPDGATGSGCGFDPNADAKPAWQAFDDNFAHGCLNRTDNDVAAVADPSTPVWVYDTYPYQGQPPDWNTVGGTSVAAPIIASVYALAGTPRPGTYPASYLYQPGHAAKLYPVTKGADGYCNPEYLCNAAHDYPGTSYNGPAGWGTPDGTAAFIDTAPGHTITVINPGTQDYEARASVDVPASAVDSAPGQKLTYSAARLPAGLRISRRTGTISGRLRRAGTSLVTVTATDSSGARGSVSFDIVAVPDLRAAYHRVVGQVRLDLFQTNQTVCLYDAGNRRADGTRVEIWSCDHKAAEQWTYLPDPEPDSDGSLVIHGHCATIRPLGPGHAPRIVLETCTDTASQQWSLQLGVVWLWNPATDDCLNDPAASARNGTWLDIRTCYLPPIGEDFTLPPGPVLSAVRGTCLNDPRNSSKPVQVDATPCNGTPAQNWAVFSEDVFSDAENAQHNGLCLGTNVSDDFEPTDLAGAPVDLESCDLDSQFAGYTSWYLNPDGTVGTFDNCLCLDNPGGRRHPAAKIVTEPCYGTAGQIWAEG
jgi:hypothetical protein